MVLEPAIGVEAHKVVEHNLELMEVVHEAVSVGFTADCQVPTDFLTSLSIASQLFVPGCPQSDLVDFFIKLCKGRKRHLEVTRRCVRCSGVFVGRAVTLGGMARQGQHNS